MGTVLYNIPLSMVAAYRDHRLIVRTADPEALPQHLSPEALSNVACLQLLSLPAEIDGLLHWGEAIPVDVVLSDPATSFPLLYQYTRLLDNHPVRISMPVVPGFSKAVKLAAALQFAVKLEVIQPAPVVIEEMAQVLQRYLHHPTASQPVDYFHSILMALLHKVPVTLWAIQETDPATFRYVTDQGEERVSSQVVGTEGRDLTGFVERWQQQRLDSQDECSTCAFFAHCGGYFKWPQPDFRCDGVKALFQTLQEAAAELTNALAIFSASQGDRPS